MRIFTRDDTDHNTEYVTLSEAMAEIGALECRLNDAMGRIRHFRDSKGRYHTQIACERLIYLLHENPQPTKP
jgi:hypothetical protein